MPTVDPARQSVCLQGVWTASGSFSQKRSRVSLIPHRAGSSSITVSTTAPSSA